MKWKRKQINTIWLWKTVFEIDWKYNGVLGGRMEVNEY